MQQKQTRLVYPRGLRFNPWPRSVGYGSGVAVGYDVGHRQGSNLVLLWLWCQLAATAPIWPLAWELPICYGCGPKKPKKQLWKPDLFFRRVNLGVGGSVWVTYFCSPGNLGLEQHTLPQLLLSPSFVPLFSSFLCFLFSLSFLRLQ